MVQTKTTEHSFAHTILADQLAIEPILIVFARLAFHEKCPVSKAAGAVDLSV